MTGNTKTSGALRIRLRPDTSSLSLPKHSLLPLLRDGFPKASSIHSTNMSMQWPTVSISVRKQHQYHSSSISHSVVSDSLQPHVYSPPGSPVHGILQEKILEEVAISSSRGSSQPRDQTWVSLIAGTFFTSWAIRESGNIINLFFVCLFVFLNPPSNAGDVGSISGWGIKIPHTTGQLSWQVTRKDSHN